MTRTQWKKLLVVILKALTVGALIIGGYALLFKVKTNSRKWQDNKNRELFQIWSKSTGNPGELTYIEWQKLRQNNLLNGTSQTKGK